MALEEVSQALEAKREEERRNPPPLRWQDDDGNDINPLAFLRRSLRRPDFERVLETPSEEFIFVIGERYVWIGDHEALLNPKTVEVAIARATNVAPPLPTMRPRWRPAANAALAIAERVDEDEEARVQEPVNEETRAWVARVMREAPRVPMTNTEALADALEAKASFEGDDGCLYLHGPSARAEAARIGLAAWTQKEMGQRLRWIGYAQRQISARRDDVVHKGRPWISPPSPCPHYTRGVFVETDGDSGDTGTSLQIPEISNGGLEGDEPTEGGDA